MKVKTLIKKYPHVPQFKNFLTAVYDSKGDKNKAYECNKLIQEEHPDYLLGKVNLAAQYFEQKEYDKIPEVLGEQMETQALYPDRKVFHVSEVMAFNRLAVIYYSTIGNLEEAESRLKIMEEIDEEHPDTYKALKYIMPERMKATIKRDEEEGQINDEFNDYESPAFLHENMINSEPKVGRNNPCPCGSGKKYKKCCGRK